MGTATSRASRVLQSGYLVKSASRVLLVWMLIVQLARWRRRRYIASLDASRDAWRISYIVQYIEMPWISEKSLEAALFRTFAIPSISRLLDQTQQFARQPLKRSEDTEILIREFNEHHFDSERYYILHSSRIISSLFGSYTVHAMMCVRIAVDWLSSD
jgi:hypothetical protein